MDDGHNGFIPASKTTLISMDYSDIHVSNIVSPLNLRAGNRFSLKGQISSDHNRIYTVRAYPDERYNLKEALNFVSQDGTKKVYNMIVCFQSTISAAGRRYGHAFLIHAIIDGIVYYRESSSVSVGGKYFPEGSAIAVSLEDFWQYYCKWDYEGLIYFGRKTYADECSAFTSNLYVSVNETTGLYSSPCTSELDPRSKYR